MECLGPWALKPPTLTARRPSSPPQDRARAEFVQRPAKGESSEKASKQLHEDTQFVAHCGVSIVVVATRSGTFEVRGRALSFPRRTAVAVADRIARTFLR